MTEILQNFQFYRESRFSETRVFEKIIRIPHDWEFVSIEEIASNEKGSIRMGPFGSQLKKSELVESGPIKVYGQENVMKNDFTLGNRFITLEKFKKLQGFEILPGDVLLTMMGSVGFATVFPKDAQRGIMDSHLLRIRVNPEKILPEYMALLFTGYSLIKMQIQRLSQGAIMSGLNTSLVKAIKIPLPPLHEQKKIAEVLRSIDEAIQAVEESIEKLERLKKGAMEQLLTKGINHNRFKTVELNGRKVEIPEKWKVVKLEELLTAIQDTPHKVPKKTNSGIPFVSVNYVLQFPDYNFYIDHSKEGIEYISEENTEFLKKFTPEPGDIIYTKWGTPGVAKLVNTRDRFVGLCSLALLKPKRSIVYPLFLVYALNSNSTRKQIIPHSKTSTRTEIHKKHIRNISLLLPPLSEQKKIAEILRTIDEAIEAKRQKKEKLERMKKAVMEKLLTGEVRVR